MHEEPSTVIGFSVFDSVEDVYGYNENACFVADSVESAEVFRENCGTSRSGSRIDPVTLVEIMSDYGTSNGEFAMEPAAFHRFRAVADANGVRFRATPFDMDDSLMVVEVEGTRSPDEAADET